MKKIIYIFLLFFLLSPKVLAVELPKEHFSFFVRQEGKEIEIVNHTVQLEKKPFQLVFTLSKPMAVEVHASFKQDVYRKVRSGKPIDTIPVFEIGRGLADYLFNPERDISVNDEGFNFFYYEDKKYHRFDKVEIRNKKITGFRTINSLSIREDSDNIKIIKISDLKNKNLYLSFFNTTSNEDYTIPIEIQRDYLNIKFLNSSSQ